MKNNILVFDFETVGRDPTTTEPCQIGAVVINPYKLEVVYGSEFNSKIKVLDETKIEQQALDVIRRTKEDVLQGPEPKEVWNNFITYLKKYKVGKNEWGSVIPCGHNIINFDIPIANRLNEQYNKGKSFFHPLHAIDTMFQCFMWLENDPNVERYSMDYLRDYFGMPQQSKANAHDALSDCMDCANIVIRFLSLYRKLNKRISFKDSFLKPVVIE